MLSFYIIFGDRNPPYPALGSNIPSVRRPGQRFHFLLCRGSSPSPSLLKQAWRNPKEGRVGCLHQNIFTRKVTDIAFTSDFCDNHSHPASPASLFLTSPRPILDVLKSLVSRPQIPSPHTRVPMSPSPCPRPTFIHSRTITDQLSCTLSHIRVCMMRDPLHVLFPF